MLPTVQQSTAQKRPRLVRKLVRRDTISRRHLAAEIAKYLGVSANKARAILDAVLDVIKQKVVDGHKVELRGFLTLATKLSRARIAGNPAARNPRHLERLQEEGRALPPKTIQVPPRLHVAVKVSKHFVD